MDGHFITCPDTPAETGWVCMTCEGDGQLWEEYPDDYEDYVGHREKLQ